MIARVAAALNSVDRAADVVCWSFIALSMVQYPCLTNHYPKKLYSRRKAFFVGESDLHIVFCRSVRQSDMTVVSLSMSHKHFENPLFFCNSRYITEPFPPSHIFLKLSRHASTMVPGHIAMSSWLSNIYITNVIIACKAFRLIYLQGVH